MNEHAELNSESRGRADLAAQYAKNLPEARLMTCGWDYREDSSVCIADAFALYLQSVHAIPASRIFVERRSRDTVGDAVYSRRVIAPDPQSAEIAVVTSDYHVPRTEQIFRYVFGPDVRLRVVGAVSARPIGETREREETSLEVFKRTFSEVAPGDIDSIFQVMAEKHPYYNGEVYSSIR